MTRCDVIVIGGGLAGLNAALIAAEHGSVAVISKTPLDGTNTSRAQGGIAAAVGADDDPERHAADTIRAGAGLCDPAAVTPEWVEEEWRINNSPGAAEAFARLGDYIAGGIDEHNVGTRLAAVAGGTPLLLVWGAEDRAVPPSVGRQGQALLGEVRLCVLERAGHLPYFERVRAFNREVLAFLDARG